MPTGFGGTRSRYRKSAINVRVWFDAGEFVKIAEEGGETGWFGKLFG